MVELRFKPRSSESKPGHVLLAGADARRVCGSGQPQEASSALAGIAKGIFLIKELLTVVPQHPWEEPPGAWRHPWWL